MAPRSVNVSFVNWQSTGINVPVPQYSVDLTIEWVDHDGTPHTYTETVKFPNALAGLTVAEQKRWAIEIMLEELRQRRGV